MMGEKNRRNTQAGGRGSRKTNSLQEEIKSGLILGISTKSLPDPDAASESFVACFWRWGLPRGLEKKSRIRALNHQGRVKQSLTLALPGSSCCSCKKLLTLRMKSHRIAK